MAAVNTGYLVDTSVIHRLDTPNVLNKLEALGTNGILYSCGLIELEVLYSATSSVDYEKRRELLVSRFFELAITPQVIGRALDTQRQLAATSRHRGAGANDLIIASCAELHGAALVHYDKDYDLIAEVTGQHVEWVVPRGTID